MHKLLVHKNVTHANILMILQEKITNITAWYVYKNNPSLITR